MGANRLGSAHGRRIDEALVDKNGPQRTREAPKGERRMECEYKKGWLSLAILFLFIESGLDLLNESKPILSCLDVALRPA